MTKQSGLGDRLFVDGLDLSGDVGSIGSISGGPKPLDVTAIDKSAMERLGGTRDGNLEFVAFFNPDSGQAHPTLSILPRTDRVVSYFRGIVLGNGAASLVGKQIGYDPNRNEDGSLTFKVQAQANSSGLEWGVQLTAGKRTDGAATNGAGLDAGAASSFGLQAYLHVFAFTGTDATIKLQESADDAVADPYADVAGGAFTAVTAGPTSERIATASGLAVERWLRVVTTGTFSNLVFAVQVSRNPVSVVF